MNSNVIGRFEPMTYHNAYVRNMSGRWPERKPLIKFARNANARLYIRSWIRNRRTKYWRLGSYRPNEPSRYTRLSWSRRLYNIPRCQETHSSMKYVVKNSTTRNTASRYIRRYTRAYEGMSQYWTSTSYRTNKRS